MILLRAIYYFSVAYSAAVIGYKNYKANKTIKNSGYTVKDTRPFKDKFVSFVKDYSYMLIPGLNLYVVHDERSKDAASYVESRMNKLSSLGILAKNDEKEKEPEKVVVKEEVKKEEPEKKPEKEVKKSTTKKTTTSKTESIEEQIAKLKALGRVYRDEHKRLTDLNAPVRERNELVHKVVDIENQLKSLYRQQKIESLKAERDRVTGLSRSK